MTQNLVSLDPVDYRRLVATTALVVTLRLPLVVLLDCCVQIQCCPREPEPNPNAMCQLSCRAGLRRTFVDQMA